MAVNMFGDCTYNLSQVLLIPERDCKLLEGKPVYATLYLVENPQAKLL